VARLRKMFAGATWRLSPHGGVRVTFADTAGLGITPPDAVAGMALTTGEGDDGPRPLEYAAARAKTSVADTVMYSVQAVVTKRTDAGLRLRVSVLISDGPHFANAEFGQELAPQPHPE